MLGKLYGVFLYKFTTSYSYFLAVQCVFYLILLQTWPRYSTFCFTNEHFELWVYVFRFHTCENFLEKCNNVFFKRFCIKNEVIQIIYTSFVHKISIQYNSFYRMNCIFRMNNNFFPQSAVIRIVMSYSYIFVNVYQYNNILWCNNNYL